MCRIRGLPLNSPEDWVATQFLLSKALEGFWMQTKIKIKDLEVAMSSVLKDCFR